MRCLLCYPTNSYWLLGTSAAYLVFGTFLALLTVRHWVVGVAAHQSSQALLVSKMQTARHDVKAQRAQVSAALPHTRHPLHTPN